LILSGFADEISDILDEQLKVLSSENMTHMDLRNAYGKNVLDLSDDELNQLKTIFTEKGIQVSSIGSPIGKYPIWKEFAPELDSARRAIQVAKYMGAPYVRVFSYYMPMNENSELFRDEVLFRMKQLTALAEEGGVVFVLENEIGVYGDTAKCCLDILTHCASPNLRLAFDVGNFVMAGDLPVTDAYPLLFPYIACVHVKDASAKEEIFLPAGEGDGEFEAFTQTLKESNFSGPVSIEHHLIDRYPDISNAERFRIATRAFKELLERHEIIWS
jgi:sugar phosphate isomerase/epimerase